MEWPFGARRSSHADPQAAVHPTRVDLYRTETTRPRHGSLIDLDVVVGDDVRIAVVEELRWLVAEIHERGGDATRWEASLCLDGRDEELVDQFIAQVDALYADILTDLDRADADLTALSKRYQQARLQDYFRSPMGERARHAMVHAVPKLANVTVHVDPCGHDGRDPHADLLHHGHRG